MTIYRHLQATALLILIAMTSEGCGSTCGLFLQFHNDTPTQQQIEISNESKVVEIFLLSPARDTTYTSEQYVGTSIRFLTLFPDSIYASREVDHWFATVHKGVVEIQDSIILFSGTANFSASQQR